MAPERPGAGSTARGNGMPGGVAHARVGAEDPYDDRYAFLDEHEPEFKWQPVGGRARSGEPTSRPARSGLGRGAGLLAVLVVVTLLAAGALLLTKGGPFHTPKPPAETATPKAPAPAPSVAPAPAPTDKPATAAEPAEGGPTPPAEGSSEAGAILEKPLTPAPPGGEDGPPAPEPGMR